MDDIITRQQDEVRLGCQRQINDPSELVNTVVRRADVKIG
jgi:hypothetical protein